MKNCRYCQMAIPGGATICPYCQKSQTPVATAIFSVIGTLVALAIVWWFVSNVLWK